MSYRANRKSTKMRWGSAFGTGLIVLALFVLFIFAVKWFRAPKVDPVEERINSIADVLTPDPISEAVTKGIDRESPEATLRWMATGEVLGEARRGVKDDKYYLEAALNLPEIDREVHYYQVWLVRQLPYDFFSLGELMTDEEGVFVMEWEAPDDDEGYFDYSRVVITVNQYEGSTDPVQQRVEGEFGR